MYFEVFVLHKLNNGECSELAWNKDIMKYVMNITEHAHTSWQSLHRLLQTSWEIWNKMVLNSNSRGIYCVWYQFLSLHTHSIHPHSFFSLYVFFFPQCLILSCLQSFWLFLLQWVFWMESLSCWNEINLTFALCMCVCTHARMCVCAHAWVSRAVKVRLIHWLQLRVVGWVSFLWVRSPPHDKCQQLGEVSVVRLLASHRKEQRIWPGFRPNSLSLIHQANFG